jgi:uncharacterized membrane protein YraQ (UPF0718 family)
MTWLIDTILWAMVAALAVMAHARGAAVLRDGVRVGVRDFLGLVPRVGLGVVGAGFIAAAIPEDIIVGLLGPGSGWTGVTLASIAGAVTPGGPVVGFALAASALKSGAGSAQIVAYIVAWTLFAFQRMVLFEIPIMPARFVLFRAAVSLPLPYLAAAGVMLIGRP